jgi:O-antigen/teichoic acid export membrane protein
MVHACKTAISKISKSRSGSRITAPLSLKANFSWTFVGNVVYAGSQWGMLVILAKLTAPETVGQFALGLAVTAPVFMFSSLQLRVVQATDAKREYQFGDYLGLRLISVVLALLVTAAIVLVSGYRQETALVILVIGLAKAFQSVSDVFYGLLQQRERMDRVAKAMIIKGPLALAALGVGVFLTNDLVWGCAGMAAAWALTLVGYDAPSALLILRAPVKQGFARGKPAWMKTLRPNWDVKKLAALAWLALPLGFMMMLMSLSFNIPRYIVEKYWGEQELGIFAALAYLMVAGRTIITALGWSASPRLAKYYAEHDGTAFRRFVFMLVGVGVLVAAASVFVALVAGKSLLMLLYPPEYGDYADVLVYITGATGIEFISSFFGFGVAAARYFRSQMVLYIAYVSATALASFALIPTRGLYGAAEALAIASAVQLVGNVIIILFILRKLGRRARVTEAS